VLHGWRHPTRGLLGPAAFLPAAERTGIMRSLTRFVLAQALADRVRWRGGGHDLSVAVNPSTVLLQGLGGRPHRKGG